MSVQLPSNRTRILHDAWAPVQRVQQSAWFSGHTDPDACNFFTGNPQEGPVPGHIEILQRYLEPQTRDWHGYGFKHAPAQEAAANSLRDWCGVPFEASDIHLTNGCFAALTASLKAVTEPGDEVIYSLPPWFGYEGIALEAGLRPVTVTIDPATIDLDLEAIEAAITPRTRVVIVNTPHNPTGKIYPPATLERLAMLLDEASRRNGREIYVVSDEAYQRIVFDGQRAYSPAEFYSNTLLCYTYGKTLLAPGIRLGYVALPPTMANRSEVGTAIFMIQGSSGLLVPDRFLLYALPELESLSIDIAKLQARRDKMAEALRDQGYRLHTPEGGFYLFPESPWADDFAFAELLASRGIYVMPGEAHQMPGYFRISLTANDEMIERSLPGFATTLAEARSREPSGTTQTVAADGT